MNAIIDQASTLSTRTTYVNPRFDGFKVPLARAAYIDDRVWMADTILTETLNSGGQVSARTLRTTQATPTAAVVRTTRPSNRTEAFYSYDLQGNITAFAQYNNGVRAGTRTRYTNTYNGGTLATVLVEISNDSIVWRPFARYNIRTNSVLGLGAKQATPQLWIANHTLRGVGLPNGATMVLYKATGVRIWQPTSLAEATPMPPLAPGVYVAQISAGTQTWLQRLVVAP